jgi:hypothetical protein
VYHVLIDGNVTAEPIQPAMSGMTSEMTSFGQSDFFMEKV